LSTAGPPCPGLNDRAICILRRIVAYVIQNWKRRA
jgi:hypothetical protein